METWLLGGLIMLNAGGWAALIALGSVVSVLGSLLLPLPVALGLGLTASSAAYAAEWLMTRRDLNQSGRGPRPPGAVHQACANLGGLHRQCRR